MAMRLLRDVAVDAAVAAMPEICKHTTLCYLEREEQYLLLFRNKKEKDASKGKWIGVGGKVEPGETPLECVIREVREETGFILESVEARGEIYFHSDQWEDEVMHLYSSTEFTGTQVAECDEGELEWIAKDAIMELSLWEGDRIFLQELLDGKKDIRLSLYYEGERLVRVEHR